VSFALLEPEVMRISSSEKQVFRIKDIIMPTSLKLASLLFLILLNFACFNRFAKTPQPEKEFSDTKKNDVAAEELSRDPDLFRLLNNLSQTSQQLKKFSEEALQLNYSF
jgi:hypothetical protein